MQEVRQNDPEGPVDAVLRPPSPSVGLVLVGQPSHTQQQDSPALWGDEAVSHMQDAHVRVAFHVLLPVYIVVLNHVCGRARWSAPAQRQA